MRVRPLSVAACALVASSSLLLTGAAQAATAPVTPSTVGNDGVKTFSLSGTFYPSDQEAVVLRAVPALPGQGDLVGTVKDNADSCSPSTVFGPLPNAECTSLSFTVDSTNAAPGSYDIVRTETDRSVIPATTSTFTAADAVRIYSQPRFAATPLSPSSRGQGSTTAITVTGTGFATGITAGFGAATTTTSVTVISPTSLTAVVAVAPAATPGTRDVVLTSAAGASATATGAFTVTPAPHLTSVTPSGLKAGQSASGVVFHGTGLVAGDGFAITLANTSVSNITVVDATTAKADLTVSPTAAKGPRSVIVTNPDGGRSVLSDGFRVIAAPGAPASVSAVPGDARAVVTWSAPADPGSSAVTGYRITASDPAVPVVTVAATKTSAVVPGLLNGKSYSFRVAARNVDAGVGAERTSAVVRPRYAGTLTLHTASSAVAGTRVALAGRLTRTASGTAIPGVSVTLRFVPQVGSAYSRTVTTAADGTWTSVLTCTYSTTIRATYAGDTDDAASSSATVALRVAAKVTIRSPSTGTTTYATKPLVLTGSVSPNKAGKLVGLNRVTSTGLVGVTRATVASDGSFRFSITPARGTYVYVVTIAATTGNTAGTSNRVTVKRV